MKLNELYLSKEAKATQAFVKAATDNLKPRDGATFDSMEAREFVSTAVNQNEIPLPKSVERIFADIEELPDDKVTLDSFDNAHDELSNRDHLKNKVIKVTLDAIEEYSQQHGEAPRPDVINHALHSASMLTNSMKQESGVTLDTLQIESMFHEPYSMNPNRPVITIYQSITEAIPFAHYLPADIKSNQAPLIIVGHKADSDMGTFKQNDSLDGIHSGGVYMSSARVHLLAGGGALPGMGN